MKGVEQLQVKRLKNILAPNGIELIVTKKDQWILKYLALYYQRMSAIGLHHPQDGVTNPKYKLLHFIQLTKFFCKDKNALTFNWDRCCHLALCFRLILFHCIHSYSSISGKLVTFKRKVFVCLTRVDGV
jgi:hypothetical protein